VWEEDDKAAFLHDLSNAQNQMTKMTEKPECNFVGTALAAVLAFLFFLLVIVALK
jgi:hypothetical protein